MKIDIIKINPEIQKKIYEKHNILSEEITLVLKEGKPIFKKVGGDQIIAVGLYNRYVTIFFKYNQRRNKATIITAYASNKKQIKYFKKVRKSH